MSNNEMLVNSQLYWDNRFKQDWEEKSGRLQTLYFCNLSLQLFPEWFNDVLRSGVTFADVGCAEGDCINYLASKFPNSTFTGIDFSEEAIRKASESYPNEEFLVSDIKEMKRKFDVIYSSNTLEHFHDPFSILKYLFKCSNKYVILLLPFQERIRFEEHFHTFEYTDFIIYQEEFELIYSKEFDCSTQENIFWAGKQILLIYKNKNVETDFKVTLNDYVGNLSEEYNQLKSTIKTLTQKVEEQTLKNKTLNEQLTKQNGLINELYEKIITQQDELDYLKRQEQWLLSINYRVETELRDLHNSNFWSLAKKYYEFRDHTPGIKHLYKSIKVIKNHGLKTFIQLSKHKIKKTIKSTGMKNEATNQLQQIYRMILERADNNEIEGIAIITSAFPFDTLYNQRTINLAKYLSSKRIATLFVIWQWEKEEFIDRPFVEVYPQIFSVPMYSFLNNIEELKLFRSTINNKYAFLNIPSEKYTNILASLRGNGFNIIYDIMDEWEEFSKVGQAPWYDKNAEESLILQSDRVFTVSQPLVDKFINLRQDIVSIGNGYYEQLLGDANISKKEPLSDQRIQIGYFGHLTDSWFDWDLIMKVVEEKDILLDIIGYGAPKHIINKLKNYPNVNYLGKVNPSELHNHVRKWHIGIIPFTDSKLSKAVDPIKIYEYLYFGMPTVVTGISHLDSYPFVKISNNDPGEFISQIKECYYNLVNKRYNYNELTEFLYSSSWEKRFDQMLELSNDSVFARLYNK